MYLVLYIIVLYDLSIYTFSCVLQPKQFPFYNINMRTIKINHLGEMI